MTALLVMLGAGLGAPSRWLLDQYVQGRHDSVFPWGTLVVNVLGSLLLGLVLAVTTAGGPAPAQLLALVGTGFCGGFTTYSTFGFETVQLGASGSRLLAGANIAASVVGALLAVTLGWMLGRALWV